MLCLEIRTSKAEIREQKEIDAITAGLVSGGRKGLIRGMAESASKTAGVKLGSVDLNGVLGSGRRYAASDSPTLVGDLFFEKDAVHIVQPIESDLLVFEIRPHAQSSELDAFCSDVEAAAKASLDGRRLRGMQFTWEPTKLTPVQTFARTRATSAIELKVRPAEYTEDELNSAKLLAEPAVRDSLVTLAQMRGRARSIDTAATVQNADMTPLISAGLVRSEYLVTCRGDNRTLLTAGSKDDLSSPSARGFRCPVCGRTMDEELVDEIYAVTDTARGLLDGSHWMTVWVTNLLEEKGVSRNQISWNAEAGEDEVDVIIEFLGYKAFLELKDRDFGLGDAYPFVSRTSRYGATWGAAITTGRVADEAKTFLSDDARGFAIPIALVEGSGRIPSEVARLTRVWSRLAVQRQLAQVWDALGANLNPVVAAWMTRVDK